MTFLGKDRIRFPLTSEHPSLALFRKRLEEFVGECAVSIMTVVVPLSAFMRLISLLRVSEPIAYISFAEILAKGAWKTIEATICVLGITFL